MHARPQPHLPPGMDHQAVGGDQQHLEEHEEVEQIARQEGPAETHELEHDKRVEVLAPRVPSRSDGVKLHDQRKDRRQRDHQGREPVEHQNDAKGRGPVAKEIGFGRRDRRTVEKRAGYGGQGDRSGKAEDALKQQVAAHRQHDEGAEDRGQKDGGDDPVAHRSSSVSSFMSIRSWPLSRKDPSASTTITALMPKEMTMAVSTSACVSGSL